MFTFLVSLWTEKKIKSGSIFDPCSLLFSIPVFFPHYLSPLLLQVSKHVMCLVLQEPIFLLLNNLDV
eukprot:c16523_g1_i1 orf=364-564(+)